MSYTNTILDKAQAALDTGDRDEARTLLKPIVEAEPNNARAWQLLAYATDDEDQRFFYKSKAKDATLRVQGAPAAPEATSTATSLRAPAAGGVTIGGAALVILGSLLPWATVRAGILERSVGGMEGDGILTLAGGGLLVLAGIGLLMTGRKLIRICGLLIAAAVAIVTFFDIQNIGGADARREAVQEALGGSSSFSAQTSVGPGLYVIVVGVIIAIVGMSLQLRRSQ